MRLVIATILTLAAATTTTSCLLGDDDGDSTDYIAISEIEAAYKDAVCTYFASCGVFPDKAACLSAQIPGFASQFTIDPNVELAVYSGHTVYSSSSVRACLDAIAARTCDRTDQSARVTPIECETFFRGTLMSGEGCYVDEECISGFCSGTTSGTCGLGTCIGSTPPDLRRRVIGETCSQTRDCTIGAYCDLTIGTCAALKPTGTTCTQDLECDYGLACTGSIGARGCGALPTLGQACATEGLCRDEGTYCDINSDMCTALLAPGAQCSSSSQCSQYYPCDFTMTPSTCAQGPGAGQSCASSGTCFEAGTYCDFNQSPATCMPFKQNGDICNNSQECASGECDFTQGTPVCAAPMTCI